MDIEKQLRDIVRALPGHSQADFTRETEFSELALDSMRVIELIYELEKLLGVEVDEGLMSEITTFGCIVDMFDEALKTSSAL